MVQERLMAMRPGAVGSPLGLHLVKAQLESELDLLPAVQPHHFPDVHLVGPVFPAFKYL
jgi:hypothetical protein